MHQHFILVERVGEVVMECFCESSYTVDNSEGITQVAGQVAYQHFLKFKRLPLEVEGASLRSFAAVSWTQQLRDRDEMAVKEWYKVPLASCV